MTVIDELQTLKLLRGYMLNYFITIGTKRGNYPPILGSRSCVFHYIS